MVVDTSALIAIVEREPEWESFLDLINRTTTVVGTPTLLEAGMVMSRVFEGDGRNALDELVSRLGLRTTEFTAAMSSEALGAFTRFGRGRHPARLNFGDCISYAVAKVLGLPLLYKGGDFALTDLRPAWTS